MSRLQSAAQTTGSFRHEAFLYSGDEHFLTGAAAFVRGALEAGEAVLVAVVEAHAALLRRALGRDAEPVGFLDIATVGRNPARIIPAWQDWVDRHASDARGFRGVSEPVWAGRSASEVAECELHERLLNTAFDDGPAWWLWCPYDVTALPASVIGSAHTSHPCVFADGVSGPSADYRRAEPGYPAMAGEPLEEPPPGPVVEFGFDLSSLGEARDRVALFAKPVGGSTADDAVLVVSELAANSIKYGGGAGTLRLWRDGASLVCEVRDDGVITDPLAGRRRPSATTRGKAGLWMANQACDLLQIRSAPGAGTVVRARLGMTGRNEVVKDGTGS